MKPYSTLRLLLLANFVLVYLAIRNYGEHFQFWAFPLSSLGGTVTMNGYANAVSQRIFDANMFLSSILMLVHGVQIQSVSMYPANLTISSLSYTASAGFLFAMSPDNLPFWGTLHACGAATFVVSMCLIGLVHLADLRGDLRTWYHHLLQMVLTVPLVVYGVLYIVQHPLNNDAQKPAVISIGVVLLIAEYEIQKKYGGQVRASEYVIRLAESRSRVETH